VLLATLANPDLPSTLMANLVGRAAPTLGGGLREVDGPLIAFRDWRPAYVDDDDRLYVVTPDGQTTLAGPVLTGLVHDGASGAAARVSRDGRHIVYATRTSGLALLDLSAQPAVRDAPVVAANLDFHWSPDGRILALTSAHSAVTLVEPASGRVASVPGMGALGDLATLGAIELLGWRDATHLIVAVRELTAPAVRLELVSALTGATNTLARLPVEGAVMPQFSLSPDAAQILEWIEDPDGMAAPALFVIDASTGVRRPLPSIQRKLDGPLAAVIWNQDGTSLTAATGVFDPVHPERNSLDLWWLDTKEDFAAGQRDLGLPLGWAPNSGSLVFERVLSSAGPSGHLLELRARSLSGRTGNPVVRSLAESANSLAFLGFVRTA
jgi:hypothetical protein